MVAPAGRHHPSSGARSGAARPPGVLPPGVLPPGLLRPGVLRLGALRPEALPPSERSLSATTSRVVFATGSEVRKAPAAARYSSGSSVRNQVMSHNLAV